jgi:hypothetical protein
MSEQQEMYLNKNGEVKSYSELVNELMFQIFIQGENPCGNLLGPLMRKIQEIEYQLNLN